MVTDSERFRFLMAHPNYWTDEEIRKEADEIGKKMFKGRELARKTIVVTLNNRIVLRGSAKEIAKRSSLSVVKIRQYAAHKKMDRFGKLYQYEECDETEFDTEMSDADV